MNYVGIDIHKKYSVVCALDERGRKLKEARIEPNSSSGFVRFFNISLALFREHLQESPRERQKGQYRNH